MYIEVHPLTQVKNRSNFNLFNHVSIVIFYIEWALRSELNGDIGPRMHDAEFISMK